MKAILNEVGPIAVSINASLKTFQLYSEGMKFIILATKLIFYFAIDQLNDQLTITHP